MDYHEYGVNIKVYHTKNISGEEILSDDDLNYIWYSATESFWRELQEYTKEHYNKNCWSEGRSGGWAVFDTGDYEPPEEWVEYVNNLVLYYKTDFYNEIVNEAIEQAKTKNSKEKVIDKTQEAKKSLEVIADLIENNSFDYSPVSLREIYEMCENIIYKQKSISNHMNKPKITVGEFVEGVFSNPNFNGER